MTDQIKFDDGAAYEQYMGVWSQLAGDTFLDWLAAPPGLQWLDVGCGNGAFTQRIVDRCAPASVRGIDPSEGQLAYARKRPAARLARFERADAMALPFEDEAFDVAVMPLVIFFLSEPAKGVGELARVVRPGGVAAAYAWDMEGGGFPYALLQSELRALGVHVPSAPSPEASRLDVLESLWHGAGNEAVETREIAVERSFASFEDYWTIIQGSPSVGAQLAGMDGESRERLRGVLRERLPADSSGRVTYSARANAVKGRVRRL